MLIITVSEYRFRFPLPKTSMGSLVLMEGWDLPLVIMILSILILKERERDLL